MPLCMKCRKQYPFGTVNCPSCGGKLIFGELKLKPVAQNVPTIIQKETVITEIEVMYCSHCGTKNNARLTYCEHGHAPLR